MPKSVAAQNVQPDGLAVCGLVEVVKLTDQLPEINRMWVNLQSFCSHLIAKVIEVERQRKSMAWVF